jgi:8-oxo-dGTP diphosphatase
LHEETGLLAKGLKFADFFDDIYRDPRGRTISFAFEIYLEIKPIIKAGDDAAEVDWFYLDALPELAFDHRKIIDKIKG